MGPVFSFQHTIITSEPKPPNIMSNTGTIVQIIGAVVDADFSGAEKLLSLIHI